MSPVKRKTDHIDDRYGLSLDLLDLEIPFSSDGTPLSGGGTLGDGVVTVTGPTTVRAANTKRRTIVFYHDAGDPVRIGAVGVASNSGVKLVVGGSATFTASAESAIGMNLVSGTSATITFTEELGP